MCYGMLSELGIFLGAACLPGDICGDPNAICLGARCTCGTGFRVDRGHCGKYHLE